MEGMVGRGPVLRGGACALEGGGFGRRGGIYMGILSLYHGKASRKAYLS